MNFETFSTSDEAYKWATSLRKQGSMAFVDRVTDTCWKVSSFSIHYIKGQAENMEKHP